MQKGLVAFICLLACSPVQVEAAVLRNDRPTHNLVQESATVESEQELGLLRQAAHRLQSFCQAAALQNATAVEIAANGAVPRGVTGIASDAIADPHCTQGVVSPDLKACCAKECGSCGDHKLCDNPGAFNEKTGLLVDQCCYGRIMGDAPSCEKDHPPCKLGKSYKETLKKWTQDIPKRHAMYDCNYAIPKMRNSHGNAIDKGEWLAELYLKGETKYLEAKRIADDVIGKCHKKVLEGNKKIDEADRKLAKANAADSFVNPFTGESPKKRWQDEKASGESEIKFYEMITGNAEELIGDAKVGLTNVAKIKREAMGLMDIKPLQEEYNLLIIDADRVYDLALKLWQQWLDSSKDYDCGAPPPVRNAESQCKDGNTKFNPTCNVVCGKGYNGNGTINHLFCERVGKFGQELAGEWTGMAACVGKQCGVPPHMKHAKTVRSKIRFPEAATYNCLEGFVTPDKAHSFNAECDADGHFNLNSSHVCEPVKCGKAPKHNGTKEIKGTFHYPQETNYSCLKGYTLDGQPGGKTYFHTSCTAHGTFTHGKMGCKIIKCGPVPSFSFTTVKHLSTEARDDQHYGDTASYKCMKGYTLTGGPDGPNEFTLTCHLDGEFSLEGSEGDSMDDQPRCQPICIGPPPKMAHALYNKRDMCYGDEELVIAEEGYSTVASPIIGLSFVLGVSSKGTFTGIQDFKPVLCGKPPTVEKAKTTFHNEVGVYEDVVHYDCEPGYSEDGTKASGAKSFAITCGADGYFSPLPTLVNKLGACANIDDCVGHTCGAHGSCVDHLMNYTCNCESGFGMTWHKEAKQLMCGNIDNCGPEACGVGKCIDEVNAYTCDCPSGYHQWSSPATTPGIEDHTCTPNICGTPPVVLHSDLTPAILADQKVSYGTTVQYECYDGYTIDGEVKGLGHFTSGCEADKSFSNQLECKAITCEIPEASPAGYNHVVKGCVDGHNIKLYKDKTVAECVMICDETPGCVAFEFGVAYGGPDGDYVPGDCQPQNDAEQGSCDGALYNLDLYIKDSEPEAVDYYTATATGCTCYWDSTRTDCACCQNGGCQCPEAHPNQCVICGKSTAGCGKPGKPAPGADTPQTVNAAPSATSAKFNETVKYECPTGYSLDGHADGEKSFKVTCQNTGTFSSIKDCTKVTCGQPPDTAHAHHAMVEVFFDGSVTYECFDGYSIDGTPGGKTDFEIKCKEDGNFGDMEQCVAKVCGELHPSDFKHTNFKDEGEISYPMSTEVTCLDGYTTDGEADGNKTFTVACLDTGKFEEFDSNMCKPVSCGKPPQAPNATVTSEKGEVTFGQHVTYECLVGFTTGGEQGSPMTYDVECLASGGFSTPTPDMICKNVNDCEGHTCGPFGTCVDLIGPAPAYTCDCQYGYIIKQDGGGEKHCGQKDECKGADCGMGVCKDLIGAYTCICPGGYYVGVGDDGLKTCLPVMCSELTPKVDHSKLQSAHSGPVVFPKTLTYKCDSGYSMDGTPAQTRRSFQVQCKSDGQLHGLAECQPVSCGTAPVIEHTSLISPETDEDSVDYLQTAKYKCDHGYALGGIPDGEVTFTTECHADGHLDDPLVCEPVVCGHAPTFPNSKAAIAGQMHYGQTALYECVHGYSLDGTSHGSNEYEIDCLATGKFSDSGVAAGESHCKAISVEIPTVGHAHLIEYMGINVGPEAPAPAKASYPNTLTFKCDAGYTIDGTSSGDTTLFTMVTAHGGFSPDLPDACQAITFSIRGRTQDAPTAANLDGVLVRIEGTDFEATSSGGHFSIQNVPAGTIKIKYTKSGYIDGEITTNLQNDVNSGGVADISMSPVLAANAWRVVLKWGVTPRDLDTYGMWGPYKACWYQKNQYDGEVGATLEHDDTNSYGPETLHLTGVGGCQGGPQYCDIKYSVNDYTQTGTMGETEVSVTVYNGDSIAGTWHIADCQETVSPDQFWWHVFTIDGMTNKIKWNCNQGPPPQDENFDGEGGDFEGGSLDLVHKGRNRTRTRRHIRRRGNAAKSLSLRGKGSVKH